MTKGKQGFQKGKDNPNHNGKLHTGTKECDGDYWHHYPTGNNLDHIRTKELLKEGFNVLRLWEQEIKPMTIKQFENKMRKIK